MKEFDENEAVSRMIGVLPPDLRDEDAVCEVLDLIYDYYDESGELDIDADGDESSVDDIVDFIEKYFKTNAPAVRFSRSQLAAMVEAEIGYEESLL